MKVRELIHIHNEWRGKHIEGRYVGRRSHAAMSFARSYPFFQEIPSASPVGRAKHVFAVSSLIAQASLRAMGARLTLRPAQRFAPGKPGRKLQRALARQAPGTAAPSS